MAETNTKGISLGAAAPKFAAMDFYAAAITSRLMPSRKNTRLAPRSVRTLALDFKTEKESSHDREGIPFQRVGDRRIEETISARQQTPTAHAVCFDAAHASCPADSDLRANRLVNIDSGNGTRGMGRHCTSPSAPPAALGLLSDNRRACCHFSTVPQYCSDRPVSLHFSLRSSPACWRQCC